MALVAWSESYTVSVRRFDEQHKKLMAMVNRLDDVMMARKGMLLQADVLTSLAAFIQTHFSDEERLMRHYVFPGFVQHKKAHDQMLAQVRVFQRKTETGEPDAGAGPGIPEEYRNGRKRGHPGSHGLLQGLAGPAHPRGRHQVRAVHEREGDRLTDRISGLVKPFVP
ncbi:MAG: Methyl-accepting chemotaxis protein [Deltaproteobacteria bacterium]|nr:Methyl-accepting chemotaxis protein [Deltaproteobacteria bacterium]